MGLWMQALFVFGLFQKRNFGIELEANDD